MTQFIRQIIQIQAFQQHLDSFGSHLGHKLIRIIILKMLVISRQSIHNIKILLLRQQIHLSNPLFPHNTGLHHNIPFIINNCIQFLRRQSQQITDLIGQRFKIPDMSHRNNQLDMSHSFTTYFLFSHLYSTTVTNNPFVTDPFVFTAMALIILYRSENPFTKQPVPFWFISTVVNCFRLQYLTTGMFQNLFRGCQTDCNFCKALGLIGIIIFSKSHIFRF